MCYPRPKVWRRITFVEGVERDHFDFEVPVEGHLTVDIFTEGGFSGSGASCDTDDDSLDGFLDDTALSDFEKMFHEVNQINYIRKLK